MTRSIGRVAMALGALALALALALAATALLGAWLAPGWLRPHGPFDRALAPPAPDYADPASWAALPDRFDGADVVPPDSHLHARQERARVDVFFVHPTTHFRGAGGWNAAVDDAWARLVTDRIVLPHEASVFNSSGRIFAPRYRQRAWGGSDPASRAEALELAYGDVRRAFDHFVARWNEERPILLAGRGQGSRHLLRLLGDRFGAGPLRERLVAAYLPGAAVDPAVTTVPVCRHEVETGCLVAWRSFRAPDAGDPTPRSRPAAAPAVCVNPLTWRPERPAAPAEANLGALPLRGPLGLSPLERGVVGARCREGRLLLDRAPGWGYRLAVREDAEASADSSDYADHDDSSNHADYDNYADYGAYDYLLFYANVRVNARNRAEKFAR